MAVMTAVLFLVFPAVKAVEVCKVADLRLVTQTGEFFLAGEYGSILFKIIFLLLIFSTYVNFRFYYHDFDNIRLCLTFSYVLGDGR